MFVFAGCTTDKQGNGEDQRHLNEGDPVVPFTLATFDGGIFDTKAFEGKPFVINFWASWCGPCKREAPALEKVYLSFKEMDVGFVGIAVQDKEDSAKGFIETYKVTYPNGLDATGAIASMYKIYGVPKTFVVDRLGRLSYIHMGQIPEQTLAQEIKKVL
ncbi:MAG: TlpA family protein disulfide reductase [Deltaproteobacteria bacterium]|nr:TlpA family protein disulfide reductase [Deltaproteobacteria bacterium]